MLAAIAALLVCQHRRVAMGIAEKMGGDPALTAVLTILTGITGAIIVTP
jgi:putative effector of murein hydrolase